jgi:hypothetical protein
MHKQIRPERPTREKHSSLLRTTFVPYSRKKFYNTENRTVTLTNASRLLPLANRRMTGTNIIKHFCHK